AARGFVRFAEPSGDDPNNDDGIGTLHLAKFVYPGRLYNSLFLGGGDPDLRDARVALHVRGNGRQPNASEPVWWTPRQRNIEVMDGPDWRRANWAYTGFNLTDFLLSGKWEKVEYRLRNDAEAWTYGGDNRAQKRPNYAYWPIDESQRHLNCNFFHLLAFVD